MMIGVEGSHTEAHVTMSYEVRVENMMRACQAMQSVEIRCCSLDLGWYTHVYIRKPLSLSIYIYIYIYIDTCTQTLGRAQPRKVQKLLRPIYPSLHFLLHLSLHHRVISLNPEYNFDI